MFIKHQCGDSLVTQNQKKIDKINKFLMAKTSLTKRAVTNRIFYICDALIKSTYESIRKRGKRLAIQ